MTDKRYYQGTGRRKTAIARVRIYQGTGDVVINGRTVESYFGGRVLLHSIAQEPLTVTSTANNFNVSVKVKGGGVSGQAQAMSHGIARALIDSDPELRAVLKQAGLLTRDPRAKERKKPGLVRARRAKQYTKR